MKSPKNNFSFSKKNKGIFRNPWGRKINMCQKIMKNITQDNYTFLVKIFLQNQLIPVPKQAIIFKKVRWIRLKPLSQLLEFVPFGRRKKEEGRWLWVGNKNLQRQELQHIRTKSILLEAKVSKSRKKEESKLWMSWGK